MGYACPVCAEPQADGEHLANHLAFSAMLGRADHADWLDEHAPDWDADGPEELAERVVLHAEAVDLPGGTDDTDLPDPPAGANRPGLEDALARGGGPGREALDPETREVVAEARELTRRRHGETDAGAGEGGDGDTVEDGGGDDGAGEDDAEGPGDTDGGDDGAGEDDAEGPGDTDGGDEKG
jgi:hypothetical protein